MKSAKDFFVIIFIIFLILFSDNNHSLIHHNWILIFNLIMNLFICFNLITKILNYN